MALVTLQPQVYDLKALKPNQINAMLPFPLNFMMSSNFQKRVPNTLKIQR